MVEWHHRLNGRESEQTLGEWRTEEPGALSPWDHGESDMA